MGDAAILNRGSILLAREPRFTDSRNDTTATAKSEGGYTMAVSFWVAEPPKLSLFSIDCTKHTKPGYFSVSPHVVGADGPFVLLRAAFAGSATRKYFLYKAGAGDYPPSLELIPSPYDDLRGVRELGILGLGSGHYLLAALHDAPSELESDGYQLRIYSSETKSWITRTLNNPCPGVDRVIPDKVITLGQEGLLGWVDLSHGLLVCNLLRLLQPPDLDPPGAAVAVSFFIPLPETLAGNRYKLKYPIPPTKKMKKHPSADEPYSSASWFRDLTCVNGVLKFVEMENPPPENRKANIIYKEDLIMLLKRKAVDRNSKQQLSAFRDAWRTVTWTWNLSTNLFWCQTSCAVHVVDIKEGQQLRDLYSAFPILSPNTDDDILYLNSLEEPSQRDGWVTAIDMGNKSLKAIARYHLPDDICYSHGYDSEHPFHACTLSRHLDITNTGIQVSACRMIPEASSSANHPSETSIPVDSCEPRTTIQSLIELSAKIRAEKNTPKSIAQNPHISQVHPVENNLPQQHKWDAPPRHSLWPHQNNLPPQQCFNKPDGSSGPGYPSMAPVHGRHNYQSLLPPSKHQLISSSEFGSHEAPLPSFNSYHGANYHGYSQVLCAPNSYAYGAHTGYDNYRQQFQQLPPTLELPIGASWQHPPSAVEHRPNLER
uniref:Uncharacterized protein n=1 Tax=Avena sativa TaxID=4498 RepID=A0ACD5YHZ4_AVESA